MNCRMFQEEHSAILSTFIKLPFVFKTFVLSIFEWPFYTGFTVTLFSIWVHCVDEKVQIQISWLHQKPADLDLHCFKKNLILKSKACTLHLLG